MKKFGFLLCALLLMIGFAASSQDYFLLPENFYMKKGEKLNLHLLSGNEFQKEAEYKSQNAKISKFTLYEGSKKTDLNNLPKDTSANILNYTLENSGLALIEVVKTESIESERNKFLKNLGNEGLDKIAEDAKNSNQQYFVEKSNRYVKTLIAIDKANGKDFDKPLGEDYEIVIQQNPYKASYGDDVTAQILFKGKPLKDAVVIVYTRTISGNVFPQKLSSDGQGQVYFKLSREGIYMISSVHIEASTDKNADFESWGATFTFAFKNADSAPNTYREFGLGDKH
ncbi:DUF4198 domain-containing protein [Mucilaginibacter aquaedulcis]|jgi:uncharacterized GH25 family protein|uniref:DUF4198 domain-containing protein n=1 Tax=Mucilaginibacter aquaedulcis TaxID=1187081 RepID=UPI0025B2B89E|nr:DUF4198 domain-containing protein [Mucilaginibacter aquaedulcis]MDN3551326.1 DUF4198 domain-containing protein [Mucilaginibacter aquaedulcis]